MNVLVTAQWLCSTEASLLKVFDVTAAAIVTFNTAASNIITIKTWRIYLCLMATQSCSSERLERTAGNQREVVCSCGWLVSPRCTIRLQVTQLGGMDLLVVRARPGSRKLDHPSHSAKNLAATQTNR